MTAKQGTLKGSKDMKEQICIRNVKYLKLSVDTLWAYIHVCSVSKGIGINTENKICLLDNGFTSVHG